MSLCWNVPFSADGQRALVGYLLGGGVVVSRVKGQFKEIIPRKRKKSHGTRFFFLKAMLAFEKTYIFFCFLLNWKGETSEILLFINFTLYLHFP